MRITLIALAASLFGGAVLPTHATGYDWQNVAIGGGGCWVTGIAASHQTGRSAKNTLYARTDCGGAYRWTGTAWTPITDWIPFEHRSDYSIESLAVNPHSGNEVYIAVGGYLPDGGRDAGTIYKSTDFGKHWTQAAFNNAPVKRFDGTTGLSMNGNGERRWGGERLAADPGRKGRLLFGSRCEGLWQSSDDAKTWTRVMGVPAGPKGIGITAVAFDPKGNGVVYATLEGGGLYRSADHGETWNAVKSQPECPGSIRRMSVSSNGNVWMTYGADGQLKHGGIAEYRPASGSLALIDPAAGSSPCYVALAVSLDNPKEIIAASSTNPGGETGGSLFWHTADEGATWNKVEADPKSSLPWYHTSGYTFSACFIDSRGDFGAAGSVWYTDGTGVWRTHGPVTQGKTAFYEETAGHEELCVLTLSTPPSGPNELLAGVMDQDGFTWGAGDIARYPRRQLLSNLKGPWAAIALALAYQESNPRNLAAIYAQENFPTRFHLAFSTDAGENWQASGEETDKGWNDYLPHQITVDGHTSDFAPFAIAMSATDPDNIVICGNCRIDGVTTLAAIYTTHGANTKVWQVSEGLYRAGTGSVCSVGEANQILAADPVTAGVFYAANAGKVYRSTDGGRNFTPLASPTDGKQWGPERIVTMPGKTGDLWYSAEADKGSWQSHISPLPQWEGLYHSTDGGQSWNKIPGVTRCIAFSAGARSPDGNPALYYYGRNGSAGSAADSDTVYCSLDNGVTWQSMLDPAGDVRIGDYPMFLQASRQTYGRVFIGTSGRGIFYSTLSKK